jgi:hypothetical protein
VANEYQIVLQLFSIRIFSSKIPRFRLNREQFVMKSAPVKEKVITEGAKRGAMVLF